MPESTHSHRAAVQGSGKVPAFSTAAVSAASVAGETTAGQSAGGRRYEVVSCHHNYVTWEHHYGENVIIKGNPESFMSCSHGAGRAMSRTDAKRRFTLDDHAKATAGVECRKDADVIDTTPMAYKSIDAVMEAQRDLVDVVHTLRQVVCVKG